MSENDKKADRFVDELIEIIDERGFLFWTCPNGCNGEVRWVTKVKNVAECMVCGRKSTAGRRG